MKELYVKPQLHVEHFTLSQSIAKSCGWTDEGYYGTPTHADIYDGCGWKEADGTIIWIEKPFCSDAYNPEVPVSEGCYNAPEGGKAIFAS